MALGTTEIIIIAVAVLLLIGAPFLVKWARALREAKAEFNKPIEYEKEKKKK